MRIAVIGATGNVGTALLRRLHAAPGITEVIGMARRMPDQTQAPYSSVTWHSVDIGDESAPGRLTQLLEGVDTVVHLAWAIQPNHREAELYRTNILGSRQVLAAVADAGVPQLVYASSVGAYTPASKDRYVDEDWPTDGIETSHYSRHKAAVEALLDTFEADRPEVLVARLRPGLIFQRGNGSEVGRYFLGPFIPKAALTKVRPPILPVPRELVFQAVHADDVADAYWKVIERRASGAFNIAADPVLGPDAVARTLGANRILDIPVGVLRFAAGAAWRFHLQRTDPGWVDMAAQAPIMSTARAERELDWYPRHSADEALRAVLDGLGSGDGVSGSPPLEPRTGRGASQRY